MNYAIIQTSGKQILIEPKYWYDIDFIKNSAIGDMIKFNKILLLKNNNKIQIGKPFLRNVSLFAKIFQQTKGQKFTVLKTKPKKKYTRVKGHRQFFTRVNFEFL